MISVVIPVLNGAATIEAQLLALDRQTDVGDFELVVSDNGSVDGTQRLVREFRGSYPIRLIDSSMRPGVSFARNLGVRHSIGNPILICDADDEVDSGWMSAMRRAHQAGAMAMGGVLDYRRLSTSEAQAWRGGDRAAVMMHRGFLPFAHGACCGFDRDVFDAIDGFDEGLQRGGDDIDFFWRAQLDGFDLTAVPDAVVHYRVRNNLRGAVRQAFHYGASDPALYFKFRQSGMGRRTLGSVIRSNVWLVLRSYWLVVDRERRGKWLWSAAHQAGRIKGSITHRVSYL